MYMRAIKEGLKLQARATKSGFPLRIATINQLIESYSKNGFTEEAQKLFDEMPERNMYSWNALINAGIRSRDLGKAKRIFYSCPCKDTVSYNSLLSGYARTGGYEAEAIALFVEMRSNASSVEVDEFTLTTILNLVAKLRALSYGKEVHCFMIKSGNDLSVFALSSLIDMYSKNSSFSDAFKVVNGVDLMDLVVKNSLLAACCREGQMEIAKEIFFSTPELRDDVTWNTMISGYAQNGFPNEAIRVFKRMSDDGFRWSEHSFGGLLTACLTLKSMNMGKEVHAWVLKEGTCSNPFVNSGIVDIYSRCGNMEYAESVQTRYGKYNIFAMTSMIVGYSARREMFKARCLFDSLPEKNFVVWTAIISSYVNSLQCEEAFDLFREYAANEIDVPDPVILVSLLGACAIQASVSLGKQIHAFMMRSGSVKDLKTVSALIDMYSKCGFLLYACKIFDRSIEKDTVIYNVMISAYAHHGYEVQAIRLFDEMSKQGLRPDAVTFIALLSACRHRGLVETGEKYFLSMTKDHKISPETDHYACMVDMYGRSNKLDKAITFMKAMPFEPDSIILSAFLNGCRANRNPELAAIAEEKLLEVGGGSGGRYFQLASVYASGGKWEEMGRVMREMRVREAKKLVGCSWVQIGSELHVFRSGNPSHSIAETVSSVTSCLMISEQYHCNEIFL